MNKALDIYRPETYETMKLVAGSMAASGYFQDAQQHAQAIVKVLAGAELGVGPFASITGIHIIQGRPAISANLLASLIKNDPRYDYRVMRMFDTDVSIEFYEDGEMIGVSTFTAEDAQRANTKNMAKYPRNMLFARAMSNGAKWYCPGIFGGAPVYTPEELGADVDVEGNIIEGETVPMRPATEIHETMRPEPDPVDEINDKLIGPEIDTSPQPERYPSDDGTQQVKEQVIEALDEPETEATPPNGNGDKQPLSAVKWRETVAHQLGFNGPDHVLATLRLLGYKVTPSGKDDRIKAYKELQAYRHLRDNKGLDKDDALAALVDKAEEA